MNWRLLVSYAAMLSLAFVACRFDFVRKDRLALMHAAAESATFWWNCSRQDHLTAVQNHNLSERDERKAGLFHQASLRWRMKSKEHASLAETKEGIAHDLQEKSLSENEESQNHFHNAKRDESLRQHILANLTSDAENAQSLDKQAKEREEQLGNHRVCGWRMIHRFCGLIGGVPALQDQATDAFNKVAREFVTASMAKLDEDIELNLAQNLSTGSLKDEEAGEEAEKEATKAMQLSKNETLIADKDDAISVKEAGLAQQEYQTAKAEEAKAAEERNVAKDFSNMSTQYGKEAVLCAKLAVALGILPLCYFSARILSAFIRKWSIVHGNNIFRWPDRDSLKSLALLCSSQDLSYCLIHVLIVALSVGAADGLFNDIDGYNLKDAGEILLRCAGRAAMVQTIVLHVIPQVRSLSREDPSRAVVFRMLVQFLKRFLALATLVLLEILLARVILGQSHWPTMVHMSHSWVWLLAFVVATGLHHWFWEDPVLRPTAEEEADSTAGSSSGLTEPELVDLQSKDGTDSSESTSLLDIYLGSAGLQSQQYGTISSTPRGTISRTLQYYDVSLVQELSKLVILLDVLVVACLIAVQFNCLPHFFPVWLIFLVKPVLVVSMALITRWAMSAKNKGGRLICKV